ncbi:CrcB family protein [Mycetocola sp. 2940]|uniref:fluoride efflux transporter FluC n=1 Tax=Mycetocola sp. 2940 TaxID=3156452 RepID=UPI0033955645
MTPLLFVALALAGGIGAAVRFVLDGLLRTTATGYPLATFVINVSGSFLLGLVTGLTLAAVLPESVLLVVGSGFLGGYTTFSTASIESVRLIQSRRWGIALLSSVGMLVMAVLASAFGLLLGSFA